MSQIITTTRRGSALLVALVLSVVPLVAVPAVAVGAPSNPSETAARWAGYEIPRTGRAGGGWIGGYHLGGTSLFLTTPTKEPNSHGYRRARIVDDLGGRRGSTHGETERAAWILSKYGGYRDAAQAAAVDASVYALVVGGPWRTTGDRGARRIRQASESATVRRFARIMLDQSRRHAGKYRARVRATSADVGGTIEARVTVTDGDGRPAAGLPVTFRTAGEAAVDAVTADDGRAVARFAASQPGWHRVIATVRKVPEHRLHLRPPVRHGQATAAEGGVRRTLVARTQAAVRGPQALALAASPATVLAGSPSRVTATVTGDGTARAAAATLYGPFTSASATRCAGAAVGTVGTTVSADGGYTLPALAPTAPGYYAWSAAVDGTATSLPASACGAVTTVKAVARVSVTVVSPMVPTNADVRLGLSGLPRYPAVTVTLNVWGPYPDPAARTAGRCSGAPAMSESKLMNGDATGVPLSPYLSAGYYALQATLPSGELHQGAQSTCLAPGTVVDVSAP
ncbi:MULTISPECIES: Ig-like domain-containing protein [unclassified Nocardioides]|uniref:Ig-like domain-containing protein n=1 Tax=unclassified Nocardioides TaxID=2615069 RepID=UPI00360D25B9